MKFNIVFGLLPLLVAAQPAIAGQPPGLCATQDSASSRLAAAPGVGFAHQPSLLAGDDFSGLFDGPAAQSQGRFEIAEVYAYVGRKYAEPSGNVLNVTVRVGPISRGVDDGQPPSFAADTRYSIHLSDPNNGETQRRYDFHFTSADSATKSAVSSRKHFFDYEKAVGTELYLEGGDTRPADQQTFTVARNDRDNRKDAMAVSLATPADMYDLSDGEVAFATGPELVGDSCMLSFGLQIPVDNLHLTDYPAVLAGPAGAPAAMMSMARGVGVYASVSRRHSGSAGDSQQPDRWVQVNRMGNPLFNDFLVALADSSRSGQITDTVDASFASYSENPALAFLIGFALSDGQSNKSRGLKLESLFMPDVLKVDLTTPPVSLPGQSGYSRLAFVGGDTVNAGDGRPVSGGWPNGRRPGDAVVDIALSALAGGSHAPPGSEQSNSEESLSEEALLKELSYY